MNHSMNQFQTEGVQSSSLSQMKQLGQDLESGNLSSAQSDFATLQAAFSQSASTASSTSSSASNPITQALQQLGRDLQSGNITGAQKDYATVQQDVQNQRGSSGHSHNNYRLRTGDGSSNGASQSSLQQDLSGIGQNLSAGSLTGAQAAYATLQQDLQQSSLGAAALSSPSILSMEV
jgi:hypothetical protein